MNPRAAALAGLLALGFPGPLLGSVEASADIGGFAQVNYAALTADAPCEPGGPCDFLLGDQRFQLKAEGASEQGRSGFAAKVDLFHDSVADESGIEVRETYLDLTGAHARLRAGRQIITWGVGDLLFTNDIFPKDWVSFFTGRPLEYLKIGSDAIKLDLHPGAFDAEIIVVPSFEPDRYPTPDKLILPAFAPGVPRITEEKDRSLENMEFAGRLSRYVSDWGLSLYATRTFYHTPAVAPYDPTGPSPLLLFFPRLQTYGASATGSFLGGVASLEGALWDSEEDRSGTNPWIENSKVKALAGYSYPLWKDATLGAQGYLEWTLDYDAYRANLPLGFPVQEEQRWTATTRLTQMLRNQTVTASLFAFWGVTDKDGYLIPSIRYAATDNVSLELGANVFFGRETYTMFGALDENDNVYANMRYSF